jgi:hypothetical protein
MMSRAAWDAPAAFTGVVHYPGPESAGNEELLALLPDAGGCLTS